MVKEGPVPCGFYWEPVMGKKERNTKYIERDYRNWRRWSEQIHISITENSQCNGTAVAPWGEK